MKTYRIKDFIEFHVTGVDRGNRRFKRVYKDWHTADCINIWQGHVWGVLPTGNRVMLKSFWN